MVDVLTWDDLRSKSPHAEDCVRAFGTAEAPCPSHSWWSESTAHQDSQSQKASDKSVRPT